jgi:hypothetical protein
MQIGLRKIRIKVGGTGEVAGTGCSVRKSGHCYPLLIDVPRAGSSTRRQPERINGSASSAESVTQPSASTMYMRPLIACTLVVPAGARNTTSAGVADTARRHARRQSPVIFKDTRSSCFPERVPNLQYQYPVSVTSAFSASGVPNRSLQEPGRGFYGVP